MTGTMVLVAPGAVQATGEEEDSCLVTLLDPSIMMFRACDTGCGSTFVWLWHCHSDPSIGFSVWLGGFNMLCLDRYMLVAAQLLFGCGIGPQFVPHSFVQGTVAPVVPPSAPLPNPVQCL